MTYFAPFIDAAALHIPLYQDLEDYLVGQAKAIFGDDIYLGNDSQDFQFIALMAQLLHDTLLTSQMTYNNQSPVTAIGAGLDAIVAINGLVRKGGIFSLVTVTLTGSPGAVIANGVVSDTNGILWNLPESVTLNIDGTATVVATCQTPGPIAALPSTVINIVTPTFGWNDVTNASAAIPGLLTETDSALRARQALSVSDPAQTIVSGILGAVLALPGVTSAQIYENDTGGPLDVINDATNPDQFPPHSITLVIDGGTDQEIAETIALRKTPGAYTDGDVAVTLFDAFSLPNTIRFFRPVEVTIEVEIEIQALSGYNEDVGDAVRQALVDYINSLTTGKTVIVSELWQAALSGDPSTYPVFSLFSLIANLDTEVLGIEDIPLEFNQKPVCSLGNIILIVN